MSMPDPFNPRPGQMPGDDLHERRYGVDPSGDGGKSFLWVPLAILVFIGLLFIIAAL